MAAMNQSCFPSLPPFSLSCFLSYFPPSSNLLTTTDAMNAYFSRAFGGLSGGSDKRIHLQCRRPGLDLWAGKIPWRRARRPTPVFLPGEPHGQRSPAGCCSPCSHKERHTTEQLTRWMQQTLDFQERFKF